MAREDNAVAVAAVVTMIVAALIVLTAFGLGAWGFVTLVSWLVTLG